MRAIEYDRYGPPEVLVEREVADLPDPAPKQVFVRVAAAGLNPKDSFVRKGRFKRLTGARFPRRLGYDFSGVVEAIGSEVSSVKPGDPVFGMLNGWAGGSVAQYLLAPESELSAMPPSLTFEEAASMPLAAMTALQALRDEGRIRAGHRVLLHGASGGVGVSAIQLATVMGAQVTTTSSPRNFELCRSLGATTTLDWAITTGLERLNEWDLVFDIFGNRSWAQVKPSLMKSGTYVTTVPSTRIVWQKLLTNRRSKRARLVMVQSNAADLLFLRDLIGSGQLKPIVERVWPMAQTAAAQAHIEQKHTRGKVVVFMPSVMSDP